MSANTIYERKRKFVDDLNEPLSVMRDFEAIEYARNYTQGDEFIRIRDKLGYAYYVDVTGNSEAAILLEVARVLLGQEARGHVTNTDVKRAIAPMFRKAV